MTAQLGTQGLPGRQVRAPRPIVVAPTRIGVEGRLGGGHGSVPGFPQTIGSHRLEASRLQSPGDPPLEVQEARIFRVETQILFDAADAESRGSPASFRGEEGIGLDEQRGAGGRFGGAGERGERSRQDEEQRLPRAHRSVVAASTVEDNDKVHGCESTGLRNAFGVIAACGLLSSCVKEPVVEPLSRPGVEHTRRELELAREADAYHQILVDAGLVHQEAKLQAYLQGHLDALAAAQGLEAARVRVAVVRNPYMNASMLANGVIHLHTGMLARLESEAQLVALLGHELAHYLFRHPIRQELFREAEKSRVERSSRALALALAPTGVLWPLAFLSISQKGLDGVIAPQLGGYSRELEDEADRFGFESMAGEGYAPAQASRFYELLLEDQRSIREELNVVDVADPYYYASHPDLEQRLDHFARLQDGLCEQSAPCELDRGRVGTERYMAHVHEVALMSARDDLALGRRRGASRTVERLLRFHAGSARAWTLLGEIRSGRGSRVAELPQAIEALERAASLDPDCAEAQRELGFLYQRLGRDREARRAFLRYLEIAPGARDRDLIESRLRRGAP